MKGLSKKIIEDISKKKHEPKWMLAFRLEAFEIFKKKEMPQWGVDLSALNLDDITYYADPDVSRKRNWEDVPEETKQTFEKLGVPQAERELLAGVGAQWDSGIVYQSLKKHLEKQHVIFCEMDEAVQKYPDLVKKYFMTTCVSLENNKFSALHGAVWSGGSFVYVPKNIRLELPLQGYFFLNLIKGGQFEHTLIIVEDGASLHYLEGCSAPTYLASSLHAGVVEVFVGKHAEVRYSTVQNWSKDVYNLATKRALVESDGSIIWVSGSLGSKKTMVYPTSVLLGEGARSEHLGISVAGAGQELDTGGNVIHVAPNTTSTVVSKSICKDGGTATYRGFVRMLRGAKGAKSSVNCQSLLLGDKSRAATHPMMDIQEYDVTALHEAKTGKIAEEELFYLMSRGINEQDAMGLIVNGFVEPVVKQLPLEYAVEINRLIEMEMNSKIG